jgi:hypothetical protein
VDGKAGDGAEELRVLIITKMLMPNITRITYHNQLHLAPQDIQALWDEEEEEGEEEAQDSEAVIPASFIESHQKEIEKSQQLVVHYTFDGEGILMDRNLNKRSDDEWIWIDPQTSIMKHFYMDLRGQAMWNEFHLHRDPPGWELEHYLDFKRSERTEILGYDCFKLMLTEVRTDKTTGASTKYAYELLVTDALHLPLSLVIPLAAPVTDLCALAIKTFRNKMPNSYSLMYATAIEQNLAPALLQKPDKYKQAQLGDTY